MFIYLFFRLLLLIYLLNLFIYLFFDYILAGCGTVLLGHGVVRPCVCAALPHLQ